MTPRMRMERRKEGAPFKFALDDDNMRLVFSFSRRRVPDEAHADMELARARQQHPTLLLVDRNWGKSPW